VEAPLKIADQRLITSRAFCEQLTRRQARNFYYGLKLLPEPKRSAMFALYAYMRMVDDIADEEDGRSHDRRVADLEQWRLSTHAALSGSPATLDHLVWPAFSAMARKYEIPGKVFDAVIAGQQQDLETIRFETFDELREYCYRVAGVIGLASIYVWGFEGGEATEAMSVDRGIAFQLTNVLRDVREDAARGRIYLPRAELAERGVSEEDLISGNGGNGFRELMNFQIHRAETYYERSAILESRISRDSRPTLTAMTAIYRGLLRKVARRPERVLSERVSLSLTSKLFIGWRAMRAK
jgi:phytoene synthase